MPFGDSGSEVPLGEVGHVEGFFGGVAADEPRAAIVGRDILTSGGTAADAAVALYFTLAVTMPSAAGLGGGGTCLVRDSRDQQVKTLDFLGQPSSGDGKRVMVPGNSRGMFALHAKFGKFQWRELLRPAENLARFGEPISRAFSERLRQSFDVLKKAEKDGIQRFTSVTGNVLSEGERMVQPELAATLALIRARGGSVMHNSEFAQRFSRSARALGFGLTMRDLKAAVPVWRTTVRVPFMRETSLHFLMPRTPSGTLGAKMVAAIVADGRFKELSINEQVHLIAEATQRAAADGANGYNNVSFDREVTRKGEGRRIETTNYTQLGDDYAANLMRGYRAKQLTRLAEGGLSYRPSGKAAGSTSFVVIDVNGGAVACTLTMNGAFGTGIILPGVGFFLANFPKDPSFRDLSLAAVMADRRFGNKTYLVGTASGGPASQVILAQTIMTLTHNAKVNLKKQILGKHRVYRDQTSEVTFVEQGGDMNFLNSLRRRGHKVFEVEELSRVNVAFCDNGVPGENTHCFVETDPRGFGFATKSGQRP